MRQHLQEAAQIAAKSNPGVSIQVIEQTMCMTVFDPRITPEAYRDIQWEIDYFKGQGVVKGQLKAEDLFDPRFAAEVERDYPQYVADLLR